MRKSFVLTLALSILIPLSASADQFGMLYGFMTTPSGSTKLYTDLGAFDLKAHKPPTGFFWGLENLRIGYLDYQMMASKGETANTAKKVVDVQVLSFEYQQLFPEGYYYHVGLANFASQFHYHYSYTYTYAYEYSLDYRGSTNKL